MATYTINPAFPPRVYRVCPRAPFTADDLGGTLTGVSIPAVAGARSALDVSFYDGDPRNGGIQIAQWQTDDGQAGTDFLASFETELWVIAKSWSSFVIEVQ